MFQSSSWSEDFGQKVGVSACSLVSAELFGMLDGYRAFAREARVSYTIPAICFKVLMGRVRAKKHYLDETCSHFRESAEEFATEDASRPASYGQTPLRPQGRTRHRERRATHAPKNANANDDHDAGADLGTGVGTVADAEAMARSCPAPAATPMPELTRTRQPTLTRGQASTARPTGIGTTPSMPMPMAKSMSRRL